MNVRSIILNYISRKIFFLALILDLSLFGFLYFKMLWSFEFSFNLVFYVSILSLTFRHCFNLIPRF